jgi:hypothetical protein
MDYNKRFDQIESILTDVLKVQEQQTKLIDRMGLVMDNMLDVLIETRDEIKGLRMDNKRWEEHERRIKKIEQILAIKGD